MDEQAPKPPQAYEDFVARFPKLEHAWKLIGDAGAEGPLDNKTARLVKLAIAIGALRDGAVRANVRKALATGISKAEVEQVISLAPGTIGLPATVAVHSWIKELLDEAT
ncbi:MAG: carboxymuconolactone decarboxylase family protein [Polyangiaceae bacterium]|nr:carboxymuconolactone decarboxylase family protein [Polyangiaceae bacterium]